MEEIEIKYLDIDRRAVEQKLEDLGAEKVGDFNYRRIIFDYPDYRLDKDRSWLRLRDEGESITLAYKKRLGENHGSLKGDDDGMYEREVIVSDFEGTRDILLKTGFIEKMYQENKRTRYVLAGVECDIDTWPLIPDYLELEGATWEDVYEVAERLGFKREDAKKFSANQIYKLNGLDDRNFTRLTFEEQIMRTEDLF